MSKPALSKPVSVNFDPDILNWVNEEAKSRNLNRSKFLMSILRDRLETRKSGFRGDIEWILDQELHNYENSTWEEFPNDVPKGFNALYGIITRTKDMLDETQEIYAYLLLAENTRDQLRELFASAVMMGIDPLNIGKPIIVVIPYKLRPKHEIWTAFRNFKSIKIVTPEGLGSALNKAIKGKLEGQVIELPKAPGDTLAVAEDTVVRHGQPSKDSE